MACKVTLGPRIILSHSPRHAETLRNPYILGASSLGVISDFRCSCKSQACSEQVYFQWGPSLLQLIPIIQMERIRRIIRTCLRISMGLTGEFGLLS